MLFRLAGRVPDELLTLCRGWLANDELDLLTRAVMFWVASHDAALTQDDGALLTALAADVGADASPLGRLQISNSGPLPCFAFAAKVPAELDGSPGESDTPARIRMRGELAAVRAVACETEAIGMWRAWRFPADGAPWPQPKRVFVIEVAAPADEPKVAARMQGRLAMAGEVSPQVEVYHADDLLPAYQARARAFGELIWAAAGERRIRAARAGSRTDAPIEPQHDGLGVGRGETEPDPADAELADSRAAVARVIRLF